MQDCSDIEKDEMMSKMRALEAMVDELTSRNEILQEENLKLSVKIETIERSHFEEVQRLATSLDHSMRSCKEMEKFHEQMMQAREFELKTTQNELASAKAKLKMMRVTSLSHGIFLQGDIEWHFYHEKSHWKNWAIAM